MICNSLCNIFSHVSNVNIRPQYDVNDTCPRLLTELRIYAPVQHTNIASDNGLSPVRRPAIIWTIAAYFSDTLFHIRKFSVKEMHLKMSSVKRWPFCRGLNVLINPNA